MKWTHHDLVVFVGVSVVVFIFVVHVTIHVIVLRLRQLVFILTARKMHTS